MFDYFFTEQTVFGFRFLNLKNFKFLRLNEPNLTAYIFAVQVSLDAFSVELESQLSESICCFPMTLQHR
jgi:hypothetical protein